MVWLGVQRLVILSLSISERLAKLILTLFRIIAITGIGYWLYKSLRSNRANQLLQFQWCLPERWVILLILFLRINFSDSSGNLAIFFPEKGYDDLFYGKVVDMLHFPLWDGVIYDKVPIIGGAIFLFLTLFLILQMLR